VGQASCAVLITQWFSLFTGTNRFGAGDNNSRCLELGVIAGNFSSGSTSLELTRDWIKAYAVARLSKIGHRSLIKEIIFEKSVKSLRK